MNGTSIIRTIVEKGKHQGKKIALALSGGGFRATLFHLGSLKRLNELAMLPRLNAVSGVSGGSIASTYLGLKWEKLQFDDKGVAGNLQEQIIDPIRLFCSKDVDFYPSILNIIANTFGIATSALIAPFKAHLFGDHTLQDLPSTGDGPRFILTASNLQTGEAVTFTREKLSDARLGYIGSPETPLATIGAISAAYPPFLSPIVLVTDPVEWKRGENSDLYEELKLKSRMVLTDGGMHDPSGIDPLLDGHDLILVSDCSVTKEVWRRPTSNWFRQLNRSTLMQTVTNSQGKRKLIEKMNCEKPEIIWWSNSEDRELNSMRTRLNRFTDEEQERLIECGYRMCPLISCT